MGQPQSDPLRLSKRSSMDLRLSKRASTDDLLELYNLSESPELEKRDNMLRLSKRDILRLSKRDLLRLSKRDLLRLSKRDLNRLLSEGSLGAGAGRELRLSKRAFEVVN